MNASQQPNLALTEGDIGPAVVNGSPTLIAAETDGAIDGKHVALFFGLTFLISWSLWLPVVWFGEFPMSGALGVAGVFGPTVAAVIVVRRQHGNLSPLWSRLTRWRVSWRWYALSIALPVIAVIAGSSLVRLLGGAGGTVPLGWAAFPGVLLFSILIGGGQEEPGWRGVAQSSLQSSLGWVRSSLLVGVIWAVWHLPLFLGVGSTHAQLGLGFWTYASYVPALSVLLGWMYRMTGGSLAVSAVFHGAMNAAALSGYPFGGLTSEIIIVAVTWLLATALIGLTIPTVRKQIAGARPTQQGGNEWQPQISQDQQQPTKSPNRV